MIDRKLINTSLVLAVGCLMLGSSFLEAGATPRKMNGSWLAVVEVDVPGEPTMYLPELGTFSTSGTVVMSTGFPPLALPFDQGAFAAVVKIGHGNWVFRGGEFKGTQLRFITNATGMPMGFSKLISEWRLVNRNTAQGSYRAEILQPDMTPYTIGGSPAVFEGDFEMMRLPIETLP